MLNCDKIIFNNKVHEIDDLRTCELKRIFATWFNNFMSKYCKGLVGKVCVVVWHVKYHKCAGCTVSPFPEGKAFWVYKSEILLLKTTIHVSFFS